MARSRPRRPPDLDELLHGVAAGPMGVVVADDEAEAGREEPRARATRLLAGHRQDSKAAGGDLRRAMLGVRALGLAGLNVTVPHKEAILPLLDRLSPEARAIGAVNTVVRRGSRLATALTHPSTVGSAC